MQKERRKGERRQEIERREKERRSEKERRKEERGTSDRRKIERREEKIYEDQIEGRNAVIELLESEKNINKLYITKGEKYGSINRIIALAKKRRIVIVEKDKKQMDEMAQTENYQGVIAIVPPLEYCEVEDILQYAEEKGEKPFVLVLDGIEDPHNLGAIIRTAETAGVHGIIIPKRRAATVNSTVSKVACGAVEYMKISRVTNISETIKKLKEAGLWICGTSIKAETYYFNQDLKGPIAIVIGNEGKGMSDIVEKNCDYLVKIPMMGKVESLNASVSAGIVLFESLKQRNFEKNN